MKVAGLKMVYVDRGRAFSVQNPRQLGTRLGYLIVVGKALFAKVSYSVDVLEGANYYLTTPHTTTLDAIAVRGT